MLTTDLAISRYYDAAEPELAHWLGLNGVLAVQATLIASSSPTVAYPSYKFLEKRFLRLKQLVAMEPAPPTVCAFGP